MFVFLSLFDYLYFEFAVTLHRIDNSHFNLVLLGKTVVLTTCPWTTASAYFLLLIYFFSHSFSWLRKIAIVGICISKLQKEVEGRIIRKDSGGDKKNLGKQSNFAWNVGIARSNLKSMKQTWLVTRLDFTFDIAYCPMPFADAQNSFSYSSIIVCREKENIFFYLFPNWVKRKWSPSPSKIPLVLCYLLRWCSHYDYRAVASTIHPHTTSPFERFRWKLSESNLQSDIYP